MEQKHLGVAALVAAIGLGGVFWMFSGAFAGCGGVEVAAPPDASVPPDAFALDARPDAGAPTSLGHWTLEDYPRVDGSTSTLPLARLIACEILGLSYRWEAGRGFEGEAEIVPVPDEPEEVALAEQVLAQIVHNKTHQAYLNLIGGSADLILVANRASPDEQAAANAAGVELVAAPIGLDALVILVNEAVPVRALTTAQIRDIYQAEIDSWSEVGGPAEPIHPYVRPVNSGSQQLFDTIVMGGERMYPWPEDRRPGPMGALVDQVANDPLAIGYSVYYWITFQYPPRAYGVVSVDGIAPSRETIASRTYPFTAEVWMVTRADLDPSSRAAQLRDWLRGPEGQGAVGRSGYVPYVGE